GNIYAANAVEVTAIAVDGHDVAASAAFIGLTAVEDGVVALINRAEPLVQAGADFMNPEAWEMLEVGDLGIYEGGFAEQQWFQTNGETSRLGLFGVALSASGTAGSSAQWAPTWSPPSVPTNYFNQLAQDPQLCRSGPTLIRGPMGFVSQDLRYILYPAGEGLLADDQAGVCVSVDGGQTFRLAPLPEGEVRVGGPRGVRCTADASRCWVFGNGGSFEPAYIYRSTGRPEGGLTWNRANVPAGLQRRFNDIAFTPEGERGWVVGLEAPGRGLLLATEDGGATWSGNLVAEVPAFEGVELVSVFALSDDRVWVGGDGGFVATHPAGGRSRPE
ncbi:MAG: YCF48-related protein, partial [Myxococcota bacterium]